MANERQKFLASEVHRLSRELGDAIEAAVLSGLSVSLEVSFNEGSESLALHQLNGEIEPTVMAVEKLEESPDAK